MRQVLLPSRAVRAESGLQLARRHVHQGAVLVARQRELVAELRVAGRPTELAERLLDNFEALQRQHEAHLARLERR